MRTFTLNLLLWAGIFLLSLPACDESEPKTGEQPAMLVTFSPFDSHILESPDVDICFPYNYSPWKKYGVLYVHEPEKDPSDMSLYDSGWLCRESLKLIADTLGMKECVVVWLRTYYPEQGEDNFNERLARFLVEEVKPFVEDSYNIEIGEEATYFSAMDPVMATSVFNDYPDLFGGTTCCEFPQTPAGNRKVMLRFLVR